MNIVYIQIPYSREQHIWQAHQVTPDEVYEAFEDEQLQIWRAPEPADENRKGNLYWAYGQAVNGRYLAILFRYFPDHNVYVITARDMDSREKQRYRGVES